jgi:WD40 repeat protein
MENTNDIVLTLVDMMDPNQKIEIESYKEKLKASCPYFTAALTNFKERDMTNMTMIVPNISMMANIINSLCGAGPNCYGSINDIAKIYEYYECCMFLGLDINFDLLRDIKICETNYDTLLSILDLVGPDTKLIALVNKNMPYEYDLSIITQSNLNIMLSAERSKINILTHSQDDLGDSHRIELLDLESKEPILIKYDHINGDDDFIYDTYFSDDGSKVVYEHSEHIEIFDIVRNNMVSSDKVKKYKTSRIHFSSDNSTFVAGYSGGDVVLWDSILCVKIRLITNLSGQYNINHPLFVRYLPDNSRIYCVVVGVSNTIDFYDVNACTLISTIHNNTLIRAICHSPNGLYIAFGDFSNVIKIWNINNFSLIHTINNTGPNDIYCCLGYSNCSTKIAIGYLRGFIKIWDGTNMSVKIIYNNSMTHITSICFLPNDLSIASANGAILKIHDVSDHECDKNNIMDIFEANDSYLINNVCICKNYQSKTEKNIIKFIENCDQKLLV